MKVASPDSVQHRSVSTRYAAASGLDRLGLLAPALVMAVLGAGGCHIEGHIEDPPLFAPGMLQHSQPIPRDVLGTWYLNRGGQRFTLALNDQGGTVAPENGAASVPLDAITCAVSTPAPVALAFRAREADGITWYRLQVADGIVTGRAARTGISDALPDETAYQLQLTGWRDETFSADIVPRAFDITVDGQSKAILRVDAPSSAAGALVGQLKIYADGLGILNEQLSEDVTVTAWDGRNLQFVRSASANRERFNGTVSGRLIAGTVRGDADPADAPWHGERVEILTHGTAARLPSALDDWQARTRQRLSRLVMAGNPAPLTASASVLSTRAPIPALAVSADRDDAFASWPQSYRLDELQWHYTLPNAYGPEPLTRDSHGYLAVPTVDPPPGGYPLAIALNGHGGGALGDFDPNGAPYWYGDAFARRGYVVMAVDVSHRPLSDRQALYGDALAGDDPNNGNGSHPAIAAPGFASDWEEDGERAWDAMRALDYALARADVDPTRVTVVGLSMGGEVADLVGAMDLRVGATLAAGNPQDLAVMQLHGNHPCFNWIRGSVREYLDPGDLHALVAPRTLIRETGVLDGTYSLSPWPYAGAKQVVRRAQPAFDALGGTLLHFLHSGAHEFRIGDSTTVGVAGAGVTAPTETAPSATDALSTDWQSDCTTTLCSVMSLFDALPR